MSRRLLTRVESGGSINQTPSATARASRTLVFPGAVLADQPIEPRMEVQIERGELLEVSEFQPVDSHRNPPDHGRAAAVRDGAPNSVSSIITSGIAGAPADPSSETTHPEIPSPPGDTLTDCAVRYQDRIDRRR